MAFAVRLPVRVQCFDVRCGLLRRRVLCVSCARVRSDTFIMPTSKCLFSSDGKGCAYEFSCNGHDLCVPHRRSVSKDFLFDTDKCEKCRENVKFLQSVGKLDKLCLQYTSLR
ncbi:hypothetical protein E2C01_071556 [Portunus trituberculatus]|uniref:Uncharacterized protein n=1 Tax=Portunus trituberculatus TaxID=210409 RepID=A0A5B7HVM9_PORTR|nr:hypothetical protein [Portunus trituberculatus]